MTRSLSHLFALGEDVGALDGPDLAGDGGQVHAAAAQEDARLGVLALAALAQQTLPRLQEVLEAALHPRQVPRPAPVYLRRQLLGRGDQVTEIHGGGCGA